MTNNIELKQFFEEDYVSFSVYDNIRKIASFVDGQKNAARKILHTTIQQNISKFTKVANLGPKVQDSTQYLHGSLEGTIVNMTADYVGSGNNFPILQGDGNFGSRFINSAAATRYIFARANPELKTVFRKEDSVNLIEQNFEGDKIEPRFYVPTIPMILVNGSEGLSIGFAQKILPRDPKEIVKWVQQKASGKRITANLTPHWVGQDFDVEQGESETQWVVKGRINRENTTRIVIESLPVGYNLKSYQAVLDKLLDDKVIRNYSDLSDNDVFKFEVSVTREFTSKYSDVQILEKFKLIKKLSENFTCVDENNKIVVFDSVKELLDSWYRIRTEFNEKRKAYLLKTYNEDKESAEAKKIFIEAVINNDIELRNVSESKVIQQGEKHHEALKGRMEKFISLPMRSLTKEEVSKLKNRVQELKVKIKDCEAMTAEQFSLDDLSEIQL